MARNKIELDLPGVAAVDVDLELGEGDDEPNNAFFDMRGEGCYRDDQRVITGGGLNTPFSSGTAVGKDGLDGASGSKKNI